MTEKIVAFMNTDNIESTIWSAVAHIIHFLWNLNCLWFLRFHLCGILKELPSVTDQSDISVLCRVYQHHLKQ